MGSQSAPTPRRIRTQEERETIRRLISDAVWHKTRYRECACECGRVARPGSLYATGACRRRMIYEGRL